MCVILRGLALESEGDNMTSEAGHRSGGSQLDPNQCLVHAQGSAKIKGLKENVYSRLRALFQILINICFCKKFLLLYMMAFMLIPAHGEEQTGICKLEDCAIIWDLSSVINPEELGLSQCSSTKQLPMQPVNICIPHSHVNAENRFPDPLEPPSSSRANVKVVVMVLAIIGGIGLAGWMLHKRWQAFTEADINMGLMSEPAVPRRSDPTFKIHRSIDRIAN